MHYGTIRGFKEITRKHRVPIFFHHHSDALPILRDFSFKKIFQKILNLNLT